MRDKGTISRDLERALITFTDFTLNSQGDFFRAKHKEIGRKRVTLSEASSRVEAWKSFAIPKERQGGLCDAAHDEISYGTREAKLK